MLSAAEARRREPTPAAPPPGSALTAPRAPQSSRSTTVLAGGAVFVLCVLLGIAVTHPLALHFTTGLPYTHSPPPGREVVERQPGDYLQYYYHLWLLRDGVLGGTPLLSDPYEFAWGGPQPGWRTYFLPISLAYLALTPLGPFAAYNAFVLLSYGLAGLAMFLLARHLVGPAPALVAAAVFAFAPYRHAVLLGGHPAGSAFFLVPLAFWTADRAVATARWEWSVAAGASLVSLALVEPQFFYFVALALPLFLLVRALPPLEPRAAVRILRAPATRAAVRRGLPAAVVLGTAAVGAVVGRGDRWPVTALALWPLAVAAVVALWLATGLALARLRDAPPEDGLAAALWCWSPVALLALAPARLVWPVERLPLRLASLAAVLVVLAHAFLLAGHARGRTAVAAAGRAVAVRWPLVVLALAAGGVMLVLKARAAGALGAVGGAGRSLREIELFAPTGADFLVRFNESAGRTVYPGLVAVALAVVALVGLPRLRDAAARRALALFAVLFVAAEVLSLGPRAGLPYELLHAWLPYFGFVRQTSKLQIVAFLALAFLAAAGARVLLSGVRPGWRATAVVAALAGAVLVDYWPARAAGISVLPTANRVYDRLGVPGGGRVAYVPIWPGDSAFSSLYQFATTLTRRPMINGYSPVVSQRYVEEVYRPLDHLNRGEVTADEHARLRALGVEFLVLDRSAFPPVVSPFPSGFTLEGLRASPYLEQVVEDPPLWLFAVRDTPRGPDRPPRSTPYGLFFEAERLPSHAGSVVADGAASAGQAVRAGGAGEPGFLVFGARAGLPRGDFRMTFRLKGSGPAGSPVGRIEVVGDTGVLASRILTGSDLTGSYADHALTLSLERPRWLELRVHWEGRGELGADYLYGVFADQRDPPEVFENDQFAFGEGPYRRFPEGRYRLFLRTRVERRLAEPVLRFSVVTARERRELATRTVRGTELTAPGTYEELSVPLAVTDARVLEFLIEFLADGVSVDRIRVAPER
jgi:hypothetical protein